MMQSSIQRVFSAFQTHFGVSCPIWISLELCEMVEQVLVPYFVDGETEARLWVTCPKSRASQQPSLG